MMMRSNRKSAAVFVTRTRALATAFLSLAFLVLSANYDEKTNGRTFVAAAFTTTTTWSSSPSWTCQHHKPGTRTAADYGISTAVGPLCLASSSSTFDPLTAATASEESEKTTTTDSTGATPTSTTDIISWKDDGFVFGLAGSGLVRPKGKVAVTVVDGDSLATQPYQVVLVVVTLAVQLICLALAVSHLMLLSNGDVLSTAIQTISVIVASWLLADFGSGVLHWSVDNYGNGQTPIMGGIIAAFQGHHAAPWTITERGFCNNVYKLTLPFGILPTVLAWYLLPPSAAIFTISFCMLEILSQEFHKWSHMTKSEAPVLANVLQRLNLAVPRTQHALHHLAPYEGNYCIVSGICNNALDASGVFRRMERIIYEWNGVESNAWKLDAALKARTLAGDYRPVETTTSKREQQGKQRPKKQGPSATE
jgi:palmitoyl-[glycerolipid] 3-(E)-desaturase